MDKLEFDADIVGDSVKIPTHLLSHITSNQHVKIVMFLSEEKRAPQHENILKAELLEIGKRCANLPLLDNRSANEILQYDQSGLPS